MTILQAYCALIYYIGRHEKEKRATEITSKSWVKYCSLVAHWFLVE
jgi:hypothetical protein